MISGLHSCRAGNEPQVGQVKSFVVQPMTGKSGKAYTKIKASNAENGGTPYKILSAKPTGFTDQHGNLSFNVEIEPANGAGGQPQGVPPRQQPRSNGNGNGGDDRSNRIERQHSQSAAIAYCAVKGEIPSTNELRLLIDWFERDIDQSVKMRPSKPEPPPEPAPDQQQQTEEDPF